jgi:nucleoside-diphosphate-sugar epimerase
MVETDPPRPYLSYGKSKLLAEELVRGAHRSGRIEAVILRPCWFYGPNQPLRQTTFFKMIKSGHPIMVGPGDNRRSMSYVDNIVQGALLARDVPAAAGETYFIADRAPYTFLEILETVARLLDVGMKPRRLPKLAGSCAQVVDTCMQAVGLYKQEVHVAGELGESIAVSIEKAERELGYSPEVELEEGMRKSIAWCRARGIDI